MQASLARRLSSGMQFLASVGSTGPFIGLFGTVYGIMNSFIGIANTNTTNLAVVAPGIAEALLATGYRPVRRHPGGGVLQLLPDPDLRLRQPFGRLCR